jgi:hypothetical protein
MNEEHLRNLLSSLPREEASEGFTERVMSRLDEAKRPAYQQPRFALSASLALIVAAWFGFSQWQSSIEEEQTNTRIRTIKNEVQQLQNDIRLLRNLAPVLYLGGDENVDFVLDLRQLAGDSEGESSQPISYDETDGSSGKGKIYND